jgi:CIC family chloride channel protein
MGGPKGIPHRAVAIFLLAGAIGAAGGLLGAGFQLGLRQMQQLLIGDVAEQGLPFAVESNLSALQTVLLPTLGGILAGMLLWFVRRGAAFGITDIVGLVSLRKGTIWLRDSVLQILSSACTIGSGGSIGKEGANSQIAATFAAALSRLTRSNSRKRAVLLGCGVAAGMATSYNAPIASAIFVMEAVLGNFAMDVFAPIVVASVLATMVRHVILGDRPIYELGLQDSLALSPNLVLAALLLGVICGIGGILFRHVLGLGRKAFVKANLPLPIALGCGGLVVGLIGLQEPHVWGNGFEVIERIVTDPGSATVSVVFSLFLWKTIATVATVGSGGIGGIFTPNLVVGAAFGAFFAHALHGIAPAETQALGQAELVTFTFVGMAGLCAALTHAPVTAVVLVFELTGHYELTLPIMLCSITASVIARTIDADSYYTAALRDKGEELPDGIEELAIRTTYARDVMRSDVVTVADSSGFDEVMEVLANHRGDTIYVLDESRELIGRIQLQDVKNFINDPTLSSVVIANDLTRPVVAADPEDSLARILPYFDDPDVGEIAVTTAVPGGGGARRLIGRVCQQDVLAGIRSEVLDQQQRRARFRNEKSNHRSSVDLPEGWELVEIPVPPEWDGLAVDSLPDEVQSWLLPVLVLEGKDTIQRTPATPEHVLVEGQKLLALSRMKDLREWSDATADDTI